MHEELLKVFYALNQTGCFRNFEVVFSAKLFNMHVIFYLSKCICRNEYLTEISHKKEKNMHI